MQLRFRHIARNALSSWLATAANMAVGFFLSPFIVHRLGNAAYGVWVLSISSVNYLALLDLGMRSSVLRFVSKDRATGNHQGASDSFSAALWVRVQISAAVLLLSGLLAVLFPVVFRIPPDMAHVSRIAVAIIGVSTSIAMCTGVFGGVLSAANRYDVQTGVTLAQLVVRVSGVVLALSRGWGLIGIALAELAAVILGGSLLVVTSRRIYPELRVRLSRPRTEVLRSLWSYSFYVFVQTVALQLIYQTDNLVVGGFISASAVTFYAIGNSLCRYADQFAGAMSMTFVPAASTFNASGDGAKLRNLYRIGTRSILIFGLPILVTLLTRGHTFIRLWMGAQYEHASGLVLLILATALMFGLANNTAGAISMGTDRHKFVAVCAFVEGVSNLTLSIILVHYFGLYGVALGTMIPSLIIHLVVWPGATAKMLGLSRWQIMGRTWGAVYLSAVPFAVASLLVERHVAVHSIAGFFAQTVLLIPVFLLTLLLIFRAGFRDTVLPMVRSRLRGRAAVAA
ncbi:oligosaccharide flippase family protein [Terriglobus sp.]|uniref:oligosaccharide flippase family protein n=1 Tax=Terriglobus sp. TaxID=1889013 RepID=UPI003B00426D